MHKCLWIAEVQDRVAQYLTARDGVSLALTCKSFYECGMNCAWKTVVGFHPLLMCLPEDLLVHHRIQRSEYMNLADDIVDDGDMVTSFARDLNASEWTLFRKHAHRVRAFTPNHSIYPSKTFRKKHNDDIFTHFIAPSTFEVIDRHIEERHRATGRGFFQSVIDLTLIYDGSWDRAFRCSPYLHGNRLTNLHLVDFASLTAPRWPFRWLGQMQGDIKSTGSFIGIISRLRESSKIRRLTFDTMRQIHNRERESLAVTLLPDLHYLCAEVVLDVLLMSSLAKFPELRHLELKRYINAPEVPLHLTRTNVTFPALTVLILHSLSSAATITPLLEALQESPTLRTLRLILGYWCKSTQDEFVAAYTAASAISSLLEFSFTVHGALSIHVLDRALLTTLFPLRSLTKLSLCFNSLSLDDAALMEMAEAWPNLESVELTGQDSKIQVTSVSALYRACPRLVSITIDVADSWIIPRGIHKYLPFPPRATPGYLCLGQETSITADAAIVVGLVHVFFPSLRDISWDGASTRYTNQALQVQLAAYRQGDWKNLTPVIRAWLAKALDIHPESYVDGEGKSQSKILD